MQKRHPLCFQFERSYRTSGNFSRSITAQSTNATNATYTIAPNTTGSTPTVVTVDQTQMGGEWVFLGSFNLNTANPMTVTLSAQGNGTVIADAVRLIPNTAANIQNDTFLVYADQLNTPRVIKNFANQTRWTWYPEQRV